MKQVSFEALQSFFHSLPEGGVAGSEGHERMEEPAGCVKKETIINAQAAGISRTQFGWEQEALMNTAFGRVADFILPCAEQVGARLGWSAEFTRIAAHQTFFALCCKAVVDESLTASLPPLLDQIWHEMILETQPYRELCEQVFGKFLDHTARSSSHSVKTKNERIDILVAVWDTIYHSATRDPLCWERERDQIGSPVPVQGKRGRGKKAKHEAEEVGIWKPDSFKIFVKSINGKVQTCHVSPLMSIGTLKRLIWCEEGIPSDQQRLIYAGVQLEEGTTLRRRGIQAQSTFHLVLRIRGC